MATAAYSRKQSLDYPVDAYNAGFKEGGGQTPNFNTCWLQVKRIRPHLTRTLLRNFPVCYPNHHRRRHWRLTNLPNKVRAWAWYYDVEPTPPVANGCRSVGALTPNLTRQPFATINREVSAPVRASYTITIGQWHESVACSGATTNALR